MLDIDFRARPAPNYFIAYKSVRFYGVSYSERLHIINNI